MTFIRKALLLNTAEFFSLLVGIAQTIILTRVLGPSGIGQYSVILSASMLTVQLFAMGLPFSFLYYSQTDPPNVKKYLMNTIWMIFIFGTFGGLSLAGVMYCKTSYFGIVPVVLLLAMFIQVPLDLFKLITRNVLLIEINARRLSLMRLSEVLGIAILITILSIFHVMTVFSAILCLMCGVMLGILVGFGGVKQYLDFSERPHLPVISKLCFMGVRQNWADLMSALNEQVSILFINYLICDFADVGYFSRGQRVALLVVAAGQAILPMLFSKLASLQLNQVAASVEKILRVANTLGLGAVIVVLLTGKWIILLFYGHAFLPAVTPMLILVPGAIMILLAKVLITLIGSRGRPEINTLSLFMGAIANALLCWIFVPHLGIIGAAYASTIGNMVLLVCLAIVAKHKFNVRITRCLILNPQDTKEIFDTFFGKIKSGRKLV